MTHRNSRFELGGRTAQIALDDGVQPRDIWLALCVEAEVPLERRHGAGRLEPVEGVGATHPVGAALDAGEAPPAPAPDRWYETLWSSVEAANSEPHQ